MTLTEILTALSTWSAARNQNGLPQMLTWLNQGNFFQYEYDPSNNPSPKQTNSYVHAYPGVYDNELYFFVISAKYDNTKSDLINHIQICPIFQSNNHSREMIPLEEGFLRIQNWNENHNQWITEEISTPMSIFQAFNIPQMDNIPNSPDRAYLALNQDQQKESNYAADLIVLNPEENQLLSLDTVTPIPPFKPETSPMSSFYLLELALSL